MSDVSDEQAKILKDRNVYINVMAAKPAPVIVPEQHHSHQSTGWGWGGMLVFFFIFIIVILLLAAGCWNWNRCAPPA